MFKKLPIVISFFLFYTHGNSQTLKKETLANQGSSHIIYANNKSFFIQESVGQTSVIRTFTAQNYSLRQGFLQPVNASFLNGTINSDLDAIVFPNPFVQSIHIRFNEPVFDILTVYISDLTGRIVLSHNYDPIQTLTLQLNDIASGIYLLNVHMRQKSFTSKIVKQ